MTRGVRREDQGAKVRDQQGLRLEAKRNETEKGRNGDAARKALPQKLLLAGTEAHPTKAVGLRTNSKFFTLCPMHERPEP